MLVIGKLAVQRRRLKALADLTGPEVKQIAIANPEFAPYGLAARQAWKSPACGTA